jgi:hypothetical protein
MDKLKNNEIYRELFTAKKTLYNDQHDIRVHGVPVELYVQDANEPVVSLGEYSVLHNKWVHIPKKQRANFDEIATKSKYENLAELVDLALKTSDMDRLAKVIDTIKRYRKAGLAKGGEFSPENLAYKAVRSQGAIDALYDLRDKLHSNELSIEEASSREDAIIKINKLMNMSGRNENEVATSNSIINKLMTQFNIKPSEIGITTSYPKREPVDPLKAKMAKAAYQKQQAADLLKSEWEKFKRGFFSENEGNPTPTDVENIAAKINRFARQLRVTAELRQLPEAHFPAIELTDLFADNPGTGGGSKVMAELVRLADEAELNVYLRPSNQENKIFYSRFGFEKDNDHFGMMVRYPESDSDEEELNEAYTSKQQVIDHFVRAAKYRGEDINLATRKGAAAWERGWRGPKPKPPKVSTLPTNLWLPYKDDLDEALDSKPYPYQQINKKFNLFQYKFETEKGLTYIVSIVLALRSIHISFYLEQYEPELNNHFMNMDITNTGDARRVFATVIDIVKKYADANKPEQIIFTADESNRQRLYAAFLKRVDRKMPEYKAQEQLPGDADWFVLDRKPKQIDEASGYIPSAKEKNDPRFKTALTVDVKPDAIKRNAKAFNWKTSRAGVPPQARADGKIK